MFGRCPNCGVVLRLPADDADGLVRCPDCSRLFRVRHPAARPAKQLLVALDVSTSVQPYLGVIHQHLDTSLREIRRHGPFEWALYLFNKHVVAYPSDLQCKPRPYEEAPLPTVRDLNDYVAGGTALLDALQRVIDDATRITAADRRVLLLTDGWERSSRFTDVAGLRRRIDACRNVIDVSLAGFVNRKTRHHLDALARDLGMPASSCCLSEHKDDRDSICTSIGSMSAEVVHLAVR